MSSWLGVDDGASRSGSKSKSRDRSRSRSNVRAPSPPSKPGYGYDSSTKSSSAMPGSFDAEERAPTYEVRAPPDASHRSSYAPPPASAGADRYAPSSVPYPADDALPPHERPNFAQFPSHPPDDDDDLAYGSHSPIASRQNSYIGQSMYPGQRASQGSDYRYTPQANPGGPHGSYQYAEMPDQISYSARPVVHQRSVSYTQSGDPPRKDLPRQYTYPTPSTNGRALDVSSRDKRDRDPSPMRLRLSASTGSSSLMPGGRSSRLSVSGDRPNPGDLPPPSPLLEAYHGTYQSLSPMPLALRPQDDDDLSDIEPLDGRNSRKNNKANDQLSRDAKAAREKDRGGKEKRRVTLYDPEEDSKKIAKALNHRHNPDPQPIIDILPGLTHDQTWELRKEYKKQVKIQGKGISLPKHLKMKLAGNFGKAAYATALGRFESEGYWANFWYQSHGSRRELLIESLMGRSNAEIRNIKDDFKDKRYSDSLTRCMEKELKMDKFRNAVLMVLEERRQEELDVYPPEYVQRDVEMLRRALNAQQGGESTMLEIIIRRSDAHLRRVLDTYQKLHQDNFARSALKKSNNLVVCLRHLRVSRPLLTNVTGRGNSAHTKRRHQQARPRRHASEPRHSRCSNKV